MSPQLMKSLLVRQYMAISSNSTKSLSSSECLQLQLNPGATMTQSWRESSARRPSVWPELQVPAFIPDNSGATNAVFSTICWLRKLRWNLTMHLGLGSRTWHVNVYRSSCGQTAAVASPMAPIIRMCFPLMQPVQNVHHANKKTCLKCSMIVNDYEWLFIIIHDY